MKELKEKYDKRLAAIEDALNDINTELQRDYVGVNILISDLRNKPNAPKHFLLGFNVDLGKFKEND